MTNNFDLHSTLSTLFSLLAVLILWRRLAFPLSSYSTTTGETKDPAEFGDVSIIVPCRNEALNMCKLLRSLRAIRGLRFEILVIDDHSSDQSYELAVHEALRDERIRVLRAPPKPNGWVGKNWACSFGASSVSKDSKLILFTDADTEHFSDSLLKALTFMRKTGADMVSAPPYHLCPTVWEKALGFFHLLPLIATAYRQRATERRLYAIGQYLLFTRGCYEAIGGHEAVRAKLTEDIELAKRCLATAHFRYLVYPDNDLFRVRMYGTWREFRQGWRRLLRLGMNQSSFVSLIELFLIFRLLLVWPRDLFSLTFLGLGLLLLATRMRRHGEFGISSLPGVPASIVLFWWLSGLAIIDSVRGEPVRWRGREY